MSVVVSYRVLAVREQTVGLLQERRALPQDDGELELVRHPQQHVDVQRTDAGMTGRQELGKLG